MNNPKVRKSSFAYNLDPNAAKLSSKSSDVTVATLDNGLTVVLRPFRQLESVTAVFAVRYGNINFPESDPRAPGAHFLEHMLFRGTTKRSADDINKELAKKSANNAYTSSEHTGYYIRCHKNDIDPTVELLSDIIMNSTIKKGDIEMESVPILNEYLDTLSDPELNVTRALFLNLFPGHNASTLQRLHNEDDIKKVTRDMLMDIYKSQYTPGNSVLVLYGAFDRTEGLKLAQKYFGGMTGKHIDLGLSPANMDIKSCDITVNLPTSNGQAVIKMGLPIPGFRKESDQKEFAAIEILSSILSERLFRELRTYRGLVYETHSSAFVDRSEGMLNISAKMRVESIDEVAGLIRDGIGAMAKGAVIEDEVRDNTIKYRKESLIQRENTLHSAMETAERTIAGEHPLFVQQYPDIIMSLKLDDIIAVAAKYLDLKRLVSVTGVPGKQK